MIFHIYHRLWTACLSLSFGVEQASASLAASQHILNQASATGSPFTKQFDEFVQLLLAEWHVPGLSIAVVQDGNTFSKVCLLGTSAKAIAVGVQA